MTDDGRRRPLDQIDAAEFPLLSIPLIIIFRRQFHNDDIWIDDAGCYADTILLRAAVATAVVGSARTHVDRMTIDDDDDIIIREINAAASLPGKAPVCREVYIIYTPTIIY